MARIRYDPDNDYYRLLDVAPSASPAEIQRAFHQLAKDLHPDRNPERQQWATAAFQAVNEAYAVLSDPARRRHYDDLRWPHARYGPGPAYGYRATAHTGRTSSAAHDDWDYEAWVRRHAAPPRPGPAPAAAFHQPSMWHGVVALLRGPFGYIYLLVTLLFVLFCGAYLVLYHITQNVSAGAIFLAVGGDMPTATCDNPLATINSPGDYALVAAVFDVTGTVNPAGFQAYRLELAYVADGAGPEVSGPELVSLAEAVPADGWQEIAPASRSPVADGLLAEGVSLQDRAAGVYLLRLRVLLADGSELPPCQRIIKYGL